MPSWQPLALIGGAYPQDAIVEADFIDASGPLPVRHCHLENFLALMAASLMSSAVIFAIRPFKAASFQCLASQPEYHQSAGQGVRDGRKITPVHTPCSLRSSQPLIRMGNRGGAHYRNSQNGHPSSR